MIAWPNDGAVTCALARAARSTREREQRRAQRERRCARPVDERRPRLGSFERLRRPVNELSQLLGLRGTLRIDFVDSPALRDNPLGDPSTRPLAVYTPPGLRCRGLAPLPRPVLPARLHRRRRRARCRQSVGDQRRAADRPADRRRTDAAGDLRDRRRHSRGWAARSTSTRSTTAPTRRTPCATRSATSMPAIARSRARAAAPCSASRRAASARCTSRSRIPARSRRSPRTAATRTSAMRRCRRFRRRSARSRATGRSRRSSKSFERRRRNRRSTSRRSRCSATRRRTHRVPREAFALDLPLDEQTGELRDDVFARWLAFDPCERVAPGARALERLRLRYVDCGRARRVRPGHRRARLREALPRAGLDDASRRVRRRSPQRRLPLRVSLPALSRSPRPRHERRGLRRPRAFTAAGLRAVERRRCSLLTQRAHLLAAHAEPGAGSGRRRCRGRNAAMRCSRWRGTVAPLGRRRTGSDRGTARRRDARHVGAHRLPSSWRAPRGRLSFRSGERAASICCAAARRSVSWPLLTWSMIAWTLARSPAVRSLNAAVLARRAPVASGRASRVTGRSPPRCSAARRRQGEDRSPRRGRARGETISCSTVRARRRGNAGKTVSGG